MHEHVYSKTLWTITEASQQLSVSKRTIERQIQAKSIPYVNIGKRKLIHVAELKKLLENQILLNDNPDHAKQAVINKPGVKITCQSVKKKGFTNEMTHNFCGSTTSTEAANEFEKALKRLKEKRQKPN